MAGKVRLFGDEEMLTKIMASRDPKASKAFGRRVKGFDSEVWHANARRILTEATLANFGQNEALRTFIMNKDDSILVEVSPLDCIWGIGIPAKTASSICMSPEDWPGQNLLGFCLMDVREQLRRFDQ
jgi:ribA/ribD-fused uncharacterized protein